jgi:purine-nucleoside phosphorylase
MWPSRLQEAEAVLADWLLGRPDVFLVLGSGLAGLVEGMEGRRELSFDVVPGLPTPGVEGHAGRFVAGRMEGRAVLAQVGRLHRYEGREAARIGLPVRLAAASGAGAVVLTNAAGSLTPRIPPGSLAVLSDYLRVPPRGWSPARGAMDAGGAPRGRGAPRFAPERPAFDRGLRDLALRVALDLRLPLSPAVYAGVTGPSYETPAEVRALRRLGADLVGMSTVDEARAAGDAGLPVLALSAVTNLAAGVAPGRLAHRDVLESGARVAPDLTRLIRGVVGRLSDARSD